MGDLLKVGFCVSGAGRLFRSAVEQRHAVAIEPVWLVADTCADAALEDFCASHGVGVSRLAAGSADQVKTQLVDLLRTLPAELVCLTFDRIIPAEAITPGRLINVHPALLPAFKGMRSIEAAVNSGARFSGATIHEVVPELDGGPIIAQCVAPILPLDTPAAFGARLYPSLRTMFLQVLRWYSERRVARLPSGRVHIQGADYAGAPISPAPEHEFRT